MNESNQGLFSKISAILHSAKRLIFWWFCLAPSFLFTTFFLISIFLSPSFSGKENAIAGVFSCEYFASYAMGSYIGNFCCGFFLAGISMGFLFKKNIPGEKSTRTLLLCMVLFEAHAVLVLLVSSRMALLFNDVSLLLRFSPVFVFSDFKHLFVAASSGASFFYLTRLLQNLNLKPTKETTTQT
jgi:hypothetical protein